MDANKIKVAVIFLPNKVQIHFDTLRKDLNSCGLEPVTSWNSFKDLFLQ